MTTYQLIEHYSYTVDAVAMVTCIALLLVIRFALNMSIDRKFSYLKKSVNYILLATIANISFCMVCKYCPGHNLLIVILRNIYHGALMLCMYVFILYIKHMLDVQGKICTIATWFTRCFFVICFVMDMLSNLTHLGFYNAGPDLWADPLVNPYTVFYAYSMILFLVMLFGYSNRMIRSVRSCLVATQVLVAVVMTVGAIENSNTFACYTYILPIIVMIILLHSNPFDDSTGAQSISSFTAYIEKVINLHMSVDYLVLKLYFDMEHDMTTDMGKLLSTFWHKFFKEAAFFSLDNATFVLAVPRVKKNGDVDQKTQDLFYNVFPKYYKKYKFKYKILAMQKLDFVQSGPEVVDIIDYLFTITGENETLIVDDKLRHDLSIMRDVKCQLVDVDKHVDLHDERVLVFCQPIKNTKTGCYDTAEALMRLSIPGHDLVPPPLFIPLAEHFGYIHSLSKIMLNKVCVELRRLEEEGYSFQRVSVNFAISELRDESFCEEVMQIVKDNGIDPKKIGIELTESQNDNDFVMLREKISYLKEKGMTIYLDDFGTGYSNFDRILKLGLDVIKYDRSLLLAADEDPNATFMVQHFAEAFKQFDYRLLFEGVETNSQEKLCLDCGADYLQGFKFSKPIPIANLRDFFEKTTENTKA